MACGLIAGSFTTAVVGGMPLRVTPDKPNDIDHSKPNDIDFYITDLLRAAHFLSAQKQVCIWRAVLSYRNFYACTFSFISIPQPMYAGGNKPLYRNCLVGHTFQFVDGSNWTLGTIHTRRNAKNTYWTADLFSNRFPHQLSSADLAEQPELREFLFTSSLISNNQKTFNAILRNSPGNVFTALEVVNHFDMTTVQTAISYEVVKQRDGPDAEVRNANPEIHNLPYTSALLTTM
jgi:hypothetical protein